MPKNVVFLGRKKFVLDLKSRLSENIEKISGKLLKTWAKISKLFLGPKLFFNANAKTIRL